MAERSKELIQVGYYLSRFGKDKPPKQLKTDKWNDAYRLFYDSLNGGRKILEFEHSLKNSRDAFDSYFIETKREGWKDINKNPAKLSGFSFQVFNEFKNKSENFIYSIIKNYYDGNIKIKPSIFEDLISEDISNSEINNSTRTEGGIKVRIQRSLERKPKLRQLALKIHGYKCQVCNFDFENFYGIWGKNFAEVHHLIPLSKLKGKKYKTDPKTDLAVLCSNCHRMVHRKKNVTLSLEELKEKIVRM